MLCFKQKKIGFKKVLDWNGVLQDLLVNKKSRAEVISYHTFSSTSFTLKPLWDLPNITGYWQTNLQKFSSCIIVSLFSMTIYKICLALFWQNVLIAFYDSISKSRKI